MIYWVQRPSRASAPIHVELGTELRWATHRIRLSQSNPYVRGSAPRLCNTKCSSALEEGNGRRRMREGNTTTTQRNSRCSASPNMRAERTSAWLRRSMACHAQAWRTGVSGVKTTSLQGNYADKRRRTDGSEGCWAGIDIIQMKQCQGKWAERILRRRTRPLKGERVPQGQGSLSGGSLWDHQAGSGQRNEKKDSQRSERP